MVLLHPLFFITLLPCKKTWKQAKRISSRRGDVYLLIKNTCSAKMKSMCLALDEQIAIEQMKSDFKGWVWCSSMNLHRLFITISVLHAVKIFGAKKLSSYNHLLPKLLDNLWFTCFLWRMCKWSEPECWSKIF